MATAAPSAPDAAPPTSGSAADRRPDRYYCEVCGRQFKAKIALFNHAKTHERAAGEPPGVEPEIRVRKTAKVSQQDLAKIQGALAENLRAVGAILHALLLGAKLFKLQHPDGRLAIPLTRIELPVPSLETHLAYTVISRSELTAKVLLEHAAENETLLRWIVRVNGWFEGGEAAQVLGAHLVAGTYTVGIGGPLMSSASWAVGIGDVVERVDQENRELRRQVAELETAAAAHANGRAAGDERGAGN